MVQRKLDQAISVLQKALQRCKEALGPRHHLTLECMVSAGFHVDYCARIHMYECVWCSELAW